MFEVLLSECALGIEHVLSPSDIEPKRLCRMVAEELGVGPTDVQFRRLYGEDGLAGEPVDIAFSLLRQGVANDRVDVVDAVLTSLAKVRLARMS